MVVSQRLWIPEAKRGCWKTSHLLILPLLYDWIIQDEEIGKKKNENSLNRDKTLWGFSTSCNNS